jgi:hypothetical protein
MKSNKKNKTANVDDLDYYDICPECKSPLITKHSGCKCSNKKCNYWFCF